MFQLLIAALLGLVYPESTTPNPAPSSYTNAENNSSNASPTQSDSGDEGGKSTQLPPP